MLVGVYVAILDVEEPPKRAQRDHAPGGVGQTTNVRRGLSGKCKGPAGLASPFDERARDRAYPNVSGRLELKSVRVSSMLNFTSFQVNFTPRSPLEGSSSTIASNMPMLVL